jgi:dTDP-4-amino-4,6-dideoxygalactose transaminase
MKFKIKMFSPYVPDTAVKEVLSTLHSGQLAQGPAVDLFEKKFSDRFGVSYPVALNSCTSALEMAYEMLDLGPGDEVITTPLTCSATNLPLLRRGVDIVWADVDEKTLCIDPWDVKSKLTDKTKAIVQVHLGGIRANVGMNHIPVISDAAQALGIFSGDITCCSFQAIKHITTGDGGMIVLQNGKLYEEAKLLRWFGIDRSRKIEDGWESYRTRMMSFDIELPGTKRHMNDIAATMGICGLDHYSDVLFHRRRLFDIYRERFGSSVDLKLVDGVDNVYWLATVLVEDRDNFARMLYDAGIETNLVQVRNDLYKIFGGKRADLPVLNSIEHKYVSLPIGMHVTEDDANYICDLIERGW